MNGGARYERANSKSGLKSPSLSAALKARKYFSRARPSVARSAAFPQENRSRSYCQMLWMGR